jgi:hypothetical protein
LADGRRLASDYTIVATAAHRLLPALSSRPAPAWKSCQTLYFTAPKRIYQQPFIGLIPNKESLINNIFYHTSLPMQYQGAGELLSVTVVQAHDLSEKALIQQVAQELETYCNITELTFLKLYNISKALPDLTNIQYDCTPSATQFSDRIFLAGDVLLNGSLNAAMLAGERAALAVLEVLKR